ncbi:ABC transporter substrate-binding protein [Corynebacterium sp. 335C]
MTTRHPRLRRATAIAVAAGTALTLGGCFTDGGDGSGEAGERISFAMAFQPVAGLSPYSDDALTNTRTGVAETLVNVDKDAKVVPALAESWDTPDERTAVFTLREGVTFHDGTPLTAEAAANALRDAADAATRPEGLGDGDFTFEATGERELTVTTDSDDPVLVRRFSDAGTVILAEAAYGGENPDPVGHGTGPYKIVSLDGATGFTADANPDYWGGEPGAAGLDVTFMPEAATRANALRAGDVNIAQALPVAQLADLGDADVNEETLTRGVLLNLNTEKGVFADEAMRTAAAEAIDDGLIVDTIYEGHATAADGHLFNPDQEWADVEPGDLVDPGEGRGTVRLATWTDRPELPEVASVVAEQLRKAGFDVEVVTGEFEALEPQLMDGEFDAVVGSRNYMLGASDPVAYLESDYTCDGGYNLSQLCDSDFDAKIEEAGQLGDDEGRLRRAAEIAGELVASGIVVPISFEHSHVGTRDVENVNLDPMERYFVTVETSRS